MLDSAITINRNSSKPENLCMVTCEGVVIDSICSQAFLFGDDMSKFKRRKVLGICKYCKGKAFYQFKNGILCCENNQAKCPAIRKSMSKNNYMKTPAGRERQRKRMTGKGNPMFGMKCPKHSKYMKENNPAKQIGVGKKISDALKALGENHPSKRPEFRKARAEAKSGKKQPKHSEFMKGKKNALGCKHSEEVCKAQSKRMLNGGAAYSLSFIQNPSKPQVELFKLIKSLYPDAVLNYPSLNRSIDIAIPKKMIAIEYDCWYWHKDQEADNKRQKELESIGWRFLRYKDYIPLVDELKNDLKDYINE